MSHKSIRQPAISLMLIGMMLLQFVSPLMTTVFADNAAFCATVTDIPAIECEALMEIYDTMGGTEWGHHDGW